jgi:Xaa-Pro aminopeptidase
MLKEVKSGVTCDYLSRNALNTMEKFGYKEKYLYIMGYGVGLRQSEFYPIISVGNPTILEENMVVDFLMPTVYDKSYGGPRLTDTILVKNDGYEILTDYSRDIIIK